MKLSRETVLHRILKGWWRTLPVKERQLVKEMFELEKFADKGWAPRLSPALIAWVQTEFSQAMGGAQTSKNEAGG